MNRYLLSEVKAFQVIQQRAKAAYVWMLTEMRDVFENKAEIRDVSTPIHHRQSPETMLALAAGKCRRIEVLLETDRYEGLIEECVDVANYVLFIASLARLHQQDIEDLETPF